MIRRGRLSFGQSIFLGALLLASCAQINFREAMNDVQRRYVVLLDEFERGSNFETRDAARELQNALRRPEIIRESPDASDPEFQRFLQDAVDSAERIQKEAASFDSESLPKMRAEVSSRCQACHEKFRPKDGR
jgi:cytochrome c556